MSIIRIRKFDFSNLAATAIIVLLLGTAFYWFTRPQDSAAFLSLLPAFPLDQNPSFFARWLGWLPTFVHVFSFSLLTCLALGRRHLLFACILWGGINVFFELGQALPPRIIQLLPDLFNIRSYFSSGVFDLLDLGACFTGAWAAWEIFRNRALPVDKDQAGMDREYFSPNSTKFNLRKKW